MSAATETVMTPTLPMEPAPAKVVKKRGPKKKTAKEADNTDKNTPIETDKKMTGEKKEKKEKKGKRRGFRIPRHCNKEDESTYVVC